MPAGFHPMILREITGFFRFCRHFRYHEAMGKGKEQFTPLDSYIMLDLETTGLKPDESEILEIGMIKVIDRKAVATFQALVKPEGPIPPFITDLTGITPDMTADAEPAEQVLFWAAQFMEDLPVLAYNAGFDLAFLKGMHPAWQDVLALVRGMWSEQKSHSLAAMTALIDARRGTHRALADCVAAMDVYECAKARCRRENRDFSKVYRAGKWKRAKIKS